MAEAAKKYSLDDFNQKRTALLYRLLEAMEAEKKAFIENQWEDVPELMANSSQITKQIDELNQERANGNLSSEEVVKFLTEEQREVAGKIQKLHEEMQQILLEERQKKVDELIKFKEDNKKISSYQMVEENFLEGAYLNKKR